MARGKIHAIGLIDYRCLQRFGKLNQISHTRGRAREAVGNEHGILRGYE
jgi:hypothetical protein